MTLESPGLVPEPATQRALDSIRQKFPLGGEQIADDAVTSTQIATDAVGSDQIAAGAVGTSEAPSFVNSTVETLKTIRGIVDTSGAGTIVEGAGFTISPGAAGICTVTFTAAFSDVPTVVYQAETNSLLAVHNAATTTTTCQVNLYAYATGVDTDGIFHFIAIGPR